MFWKVFIPCIAVTGPPFTGLSLLAMDEALPFHWAMSLAMVLLIGSAVVTYLFLRKMDDAIKALHEVRVAIIEFSQNLLQHDHASKERDNLISARVDQQGERVGKLCEQMQEILIKSSDGVCPFRTKETKSG